MQEQPDSWSISEAVTESYEEFGRRFGRDLIGSAFDIICRDPFGTSALHLKMSREIDESLRHMLNTSAEGQTIWMANARSSPGDLQLLQHIGVRWVYARDHMVSLPWDTVVPRRNVEGLGDHFSLQVLKQMLYRGAAPDTEPPYPGSAQQSQQ